MIRIIRTYGECRDFTSGFHGDPDFSDPMLQNAEQVRSNLILPIDNPNRHLVLGVYDEGRMTGLFAFLVLRDEKYIEMLAGLSRERAAYEEALGYLERSYPGFSVDFVFNPRNHLLKKLLDLEEYRRMGYGRKLLAKAIESNSPNGMFLYLDVDNAPALRLYESMGFVKADGQNNLTVHWTIPEA